MPNWVRRTAQLYGAALGLTLSQLSPLPEARIRTRPAIARVAPMERSSSSGFDPREEIAPGLILTMPMDDDVVPRVDVVRDASPVGPSPFALN